MPIDLKSLRLSPSKSLTINVSLQAGHSLTLSTTQNTPILPPMPSYNSSFKPCVPDLNLSKNAVLINDFLVEVQEAGFGVQLNSDKCIGGLLFADDFVDISNLSKHAVHKYCNTGGRRLMWVSILNVVLPVHPCLGANIFTCETFTEAISNFSKAMGCCGEG